MLNSTSFIITYEDSDSKGKCIIGIVSNDDEIAFGSEYTFKASNIDYTSVCALSSDKVCIIYSDTNDSSKGKMVIGTISNDDEIAFGSEYTFNNADTNTAMEIIMLSSVAFAIRFNSTTKAGTLSGLNVPSFGSESSFATNVSEENIIMLASNKIAAIYSDDNDSNKGKIKIGTISGTNISYGSAYEFEEDAIEAISVHPMSSYKFVVSYKNTSNSNKGTCVGISVYDNYPYIGESLVFKNASTYYISSSKLDNKKFIISYSSGSDAYSIVGNI